MYPDCENNSNPGNCILNSNKTDFVNACLMMDEKMNSIAGPENKSEKKTMFIFDSAGRFIDFNASVPRLTGYSAGELSDMNIADLLVGEIEDEVRRIRKIYDRQDQAFQMQTYLMQKNGRVSQLMLEIKELDTNRFIGYCQHISPSQLMTRVVQVGNDISRLPVREGSFQDNINRLGQALEKIPDINGLAIYYSGKEQCHQPGYCHGIDKEFCERIANYTLNSVNPGPEPPIQYLDASMLFGEQETDCLNIGDYSFVIMPFTDQPDAHFTLIFFIKQIEEFKPVYKSVFRYLYPLIDNYFLQMQTREFRSLLCSIFDKTGDMVLVTDDTGRIIYGNPLFYQFSKWGKTDIFNKNISAIFDRKATAQLKDCFRKNNNSAVPGVFSANMVFGNNVKVPVITKMMTTEWGQKNFYYFIIDKSQSAINHFVENITDKTKLRHRQRLESIGTFTSSITHEINNPLTGVINYAQLLYERVKDEKLRQFSKGIVDESERIISIIRKLLAFSKIDQDKTEPCSIVEIIRTVLDLLDNKFKKEQITVNLNYGNDLPPLHCRRYQIEQVMVNLLNNARNALNERYRDYNKNKKIDIEVHKVNDGCKEWVQISVTDFGIGIPSDHIEHIFKPFFTTNVNQQGTGLGLAVSLGIIHDHAGRCTVESDVNKYTRFLIDLPV